jgi:hypothetical protein
MEGQDVSAQAQTVCYSCALGDFGHSYILSQHEESRSGVAHQGAGFVAPGHPPASPCHISSPIRASQIDKNRSQKSRVLFGQHLARIRDGGFHFRSIVRHACLTRCACFAEVKDGRVSTMASDIYSAGKILEELL